MCQRAGWDTFSVSQTLLLTEWSPSCARGVWSHPRLINHITCCLNHRGVCVAYTPAHFVASVSCISIPLTFTQGCCAVARVKNVRKSCWSVCLLCMSRSLTVDFFCLQRPILPSTSPDRQGSLTLVTMRCFSRFAHSNFGAGPPHISCSARAPFSRAPLSPSSGDENALSHRFGNSRVTFRSADHRLGGRGGGVPRHTHTHL